MYIYGIKSSFITRPWLIRLLSKVGHGVEILNLGSCENLSDCVLEVIAQYCTSLKEISWIFRDSSESISPEVLLNFVTQCPNLEKYEFSVDPTENFPEVLELCSGNIRELQCNTFELKSSDTIETIQKSLIAIASKNKHIVKLDTNLITERGLEQLCTLLPNLKDVSVTMCEIDKVYPAFQHLKCLEELDLAETYVDDNELSRTLELCPNLTYLNISGCSKITDVGISSVAKSCKKLKTLSLDADRYSAGGNVTDSGLLDIAHSLGPSLERLWMSFCTSVTSIGIIGLSKHCQNLRELYVEGCNLCQNAFMYIAENCHSLCVLDASECLQIKSSVMEKLLELPNLKKLSVVSCTFIKDLKLPVSLKNVSSNIASELESGKGAYLERKSSDGIRQSKLESLNLNFCCHLEAIALVSIALYCPLLTRLELCACCQVTDLAIKVLVENCSRLRHLDLKNGSSFRASNLTDASLFHIASNCKNLQTLNIASNFKMTLSGISQVLNGCSSLESLALSLSTTLTSKDVIEIIKQTRPIWKEDCYYRNKTQVKFIFPGIRR